MVTGKPPTGQLYVWLRAGLQINITTNINIATYTPTLWFAQPEARQRAFSVITLLYLHISMKHFSIFPVYLEAKHRRTV